MLQNTINYLASQDWSPIKSALDYLINAAIIAIAGAVLVLGKRGLAILTNINLNNAAANVVGQATLQTGITVAQASGDPVSRAMLQAHVNALAGPFAEKFEGSLKRLGATPEDAAALVEKSLGRQINGAASNVYAENAP